MLEPRYPISTERLVVRPYTEDDLAGLVALQTDPDVVRYLYHGPRDTEAIRESLAQRQKQCRLAGEGDRLILAVVLRGSGEFVGELHLEWLSEEHGGGEIGFVFDPRHHGKGYAYESSIELLRVAFEDLRLHRVIGRCDARNTASTALMRRLGLVQEAHFVRNEWVKGEWVDELVFALRAEQWRG